MPPFNFHIRSIKPYVYPVNTKSANNFAELKMFLWYIIRELGIKQSIRGWFMINTNDFIYEFLISSGLLDQQSLASAKERSEKEGIPLDVMAFRMGLLNKQEYLRRLSDELNIEAVDISDIEVPKEVIGALPAKVASHYGVLPLALEGNILTIAFPDNIYFTAIDDVKLLTGKDISAVLAWREDIDSAIKRYYGIGAEAIEQMESEQKDSWGLESDLKTLDASDSSEASIVRFVNQLLMQAVKENASDLHIEPYEDEVMTRFRIDGILHMAPTPPNMRSIYSSVVARVKVMAGMDIAEKRLPQDGRIRAKISGQELDLRVSTMPSQYGESVQIRILRKEGFLGINDLGFADKNLHIITSNISSPWGLILITGPTGSGKSTTLYACLSEINKPTRKIITLEDPIEYQIKGILQMQIQPKIGFDFALGLRHILRHDPDVVMIGEMRDSETAEIGVRASLTGHLVFSTLHTNNAAGAVTRLIDMGIKPYLVASALKCVVAQRLVRRICPSCKKSKFISSKGLPVNTRSDTVEVFFGEGCPACYFTGYKGRYGIHEVLYIDEDIRDMIISDASAQEIAGKAAEKGMRQLLEDGVHKALLGITSLEEVYRVIQE